MARLRPLAHGPRRAVDRGIIQTGVPLIMATKKQTAARKRYAQQCRSRIPAICSEAAARRNLLLTAAK